MGQDGILRPISNRPGRGKVALGRVRPARGKKPAASYHNSHARSRTGLENPLRIHEVGRTAQARAGGGDLRDGVRAEVRARTSRSGP